MKQMTETFSYLIGECIIFLYNFLYIITEIMEIFRVKLLWTSTKKRSKKEKKTLIIYQLAQILFLYLLFYFSYQNYWGSPHGIMTKVLGFSLKVSKFKFQLHCYVLFWTNTPGKDIEPSYPTSNRLNSITAVVLQGLLWHKITHEGWYTIE